MIKMKTWLLIVLTQFAFLINILEIQNLGKEIGIDIQTKDLYLADSDKIKKISDDEVGDYQKFRKEIFNGPN